MKHFPITIFVLVVLMSIPNLAHAQFWSGILNADRAIDWTQAGIPGGVPTTRTQCGSTISAPSSASAIQSALDSCGTNQYVLLGAGTFNISTTINVPANKTLRGSGADQTILNVTGSGQAPITLGTGGVPYSGVNITSGATAGSTSIVVASTSGMAVGGYLVVSELNDTANLVTQNGGEGPCNWCDGWSATNGARARGQIVEITSIAGTTMGITPPLYSAYTLSPTVVAFTASEKYAGVEDLQVYMNNTGWTDAFFMSRCAYCWIKGTEVNYADGDYVEVDWGFKDEIRDNYFSNGYKRGPGLTDTDIFIVFKTSASKIENNILERSQAGIFPSRGAAGNVIAYNYIFSSFTTPSNFAIGGIGMHGAHPQFNLIEGNVFPLYYPDQVWGSSAYNTLFRNWVVGTSLACTPLTGRGTVDCTGANGHYLYQAARAVQISHLATHANLVGDVVGSSQMQGLAITKTASVAYPSTRAYDTVAYGYSWGYGESSDDGSGSGCGSGGIAPCHGTEALSTSFVHGDYNHISGAITWSGSVTHTLPSSFYLSAKPAWFGSQKYPAIGPDVTGGPGPGGHTYLIPAQYCYLNVMGGSDGGAGSPLTFNASACYSGGSQSPAPAVSWSPASYDFLDVAIGSVGTHSFTLQNTGNAALNVSLAVTAGDIWSIGSTTCGSSLAASASCTVTVGFSPQNPWGYTGDLTETDSANGVSGTVSLSGAGMNAATPAPPAGLSATVM